VNSVVAGENQQEDLIMAAKKDTTIGTIKATRRRTIPTGPQSSSKTYELAAEMLWDLTDGPIAH